MEQPVTFESQEQQVVGMLHIPDAPPPEGCPGVVFLHGFTDDRTGGGRLFVTIARQLTDMGIACLRIDFRGSGDSDLKFVESTISTQIHDAHHAVEFLRDRPEVDLSRIGVLGMSMGAIIASYLVSADEDIKAIVLLCPIADPAAASARKSGPTTNNDLAARGYTDVDGWAISKTFIKEMNACKPLEEIVKSDAPVLVVHGDADEIVPVADAEMYEEELEAAEKDFMIHIIHEADHKFGSNRWQYEVLAVTTDWFLKRL